MARRDLPDVPMPPGPYLLPYQLNRLVNLMNVAWRDAIRPHGLTVPRWQTLSVLSFLDGSRVTEIAELTGMTQPVMSRVLDQMERDGLLVRRAAIEDARATEAWLTPEGRALFVRLLPEATRFVSAMIAGLDRDQQRTLTDLLAVVLDNTSAGPSTAIDLTDAAPATSEPAPDEPSRKDAA